MRESETAWAHHFRFNNGSTNNIPKQTGAFYYDNVGIRAKHLMKTPSTQNPFWINDNNLLRPKRVCLDACVGLGFGLRWCSAVWHGGGASESAQSHYHCVSLNLRKLIDTY